MTGQQETTPVQTAESQGFLSTTRRKVGAGAGAFVLLAGAAFGISEMASGDETPKDTAGTTVSNSEACDDISFGNPTENLEHYAKTAFLPKNEVNSKEEVKAEITGKKGVFTTPLGQEMDVHSMAAITSALTIPATDGKKAQSGYDYVAHYDKTLASLKGSNKAEVAQEACGNAYDVMKQVATYNEKWATEGETVVKLEATRGKDSKIDCMTLVKVKVGEKGLKGIEFKNNADTKNVDGFTSVLEDENGDLYVKGITIDNKDKDNKSKKSGDSKSDQKGGNRGNSIAGTGNGTGGHSGGGCSGDCGGGEHTDTPTSPKPTPKPPTTTTPPPTTPTPQPTKPPINCDPEIDVC